MQVISHADWTVKKIGIQLGCLPTACALPLKKGVRHVPMAAWR